MSHENLLSMSEVDFEEHAATYYLSLKGGTAEADIKKWGTEKIRKIADAFADLKAEIDKIIAKKKAYIEQTVCQKYQYCEKLKSDPQYALATLIDAGISGALGIPLPAATAIVFLLRYGYFDRICDC